MEEIILEHEPDVAWLIALWLAIHGGDPASEPTSVDDTTVLLATTLSLRLEEVYGAGAAARNVLEKRLAGLGIALTGGRDTGPQVEAAEPVVEPVGGRCISIDGVIWCVKPLKPVKPPTP
jgi:hypothetical protein